MTERDRDRWDGRWRERGRAPIAVAPPRAFAEATDWFPETGLALELACGRGDAALWLADRGLEVIAVDVSPVAIDLAARLVAMFDRVHATALADRVTFDVVDLDEGLPATPPVDVVLCHFFRDERLDTEIADRLVPGGLLAIAVLSEVGHGPGRFRARPGALKHAFAEFETLADGEGDGTAWLVARKPE